MAWSLVGRATVEVPLLEFLDVGDLFGAGLGGVRRGFESKSNER